MMIDAPATLKSLRGMFVQRGFDIRFVGGCVRDTLLGISPKDVDLCTDADPTEQMAIYRDNDVRFITTGLQHGTITVVLDGEAFEITSLRTETDHDGRWATVQYTRDWESDLSRRDLTFNAMAMTFDGVLIDPFGGAQDLNDGVVRFVGSADERIREDYLRILRWFRFYGRFANANNRSLQFESLESIRNNAAGLAKISRERVWSEMARIISGPRNCEAMEIIDRCSIFQYIDMPQPKWFHNASGALAVATQLTKNPVTLLTAYLCGGGVTNVSAVASAWKWSTDERLLGEYVARQWGSPMNETTAKFTIAVEGHPKAFVVEHFRSIGAADLARTILEWDAPVFPVKGADLIALGMSPGPGMGRVLTDMRQQWGLNGYPGDKDTVLRFRAAS
jgi:tRNA nucleotidyltransferase (CCA-adding enzyme)